MAFTTAEKLEIKNVILKEIKYLTRLCEPRGRFTPFLSTARRVLRGGYDERDERVIRPLLGRDQVMRRRDLVKLFKAKHPGKDWDRLQSRVESFICG